MTPIALFLAPLLGGQALAARLPELAVVGVHVDQLDAEQGEEAAAKLGEAIERSGVMEYVEPQHVSARLKGREELVIQDMALKTGQTRLEEGRVLYERADPESAVPLLTRAVEQLTEGIASTGQTRELIDAYLMLGLANAGLGEQDAARAAFRHVVVLDPARELDPISYPPSIINMFGEVKNEVASAGSAALMVGAPKPPEGAAPAQVWVDGRPMGDAPVSLVDLPAGAHHVFVRGWEGRRSYTQVDLEASGKRQVDVELNTLTFAQSAESSSGQSRQTELLYRALGEYGQTSLVLLAGESGDGSVAVQLYSPRTGSFSQALVTKAGDDPVAAMVDLLPALGSYIGDTGDIRSDRVSIDVPAFDIASNAVLNQLLLDPNVELQQQIIESGGLKWWVWAGLGAVVAGGAGTTAALLLAGGGGEPTDNGTITLAID